MAYLGMGLFLFMQPPVESLVVNHSIRSRVDLRGVTYNMQNGRSSWQRPARQQGSEEEEGEGGPDGKIQGNKQNRKSLAETNQAINFIEGAVKKISGDEDYKFGDYSKKALSELTGKDLDNEEYQFGDITKNLVNQAGKTITGRDDYVFGDITRGVLNDLEQSLEEWKGPALNELPFELAREILSKLSPSQRRATYVAIVRLLAIALLTWGFFANLCTSVAVTCAWTHSCISPVTTGCWSPFHVSLVHRQAFLNSYALVRLALDPLFLLVQGAGTLFGIRRYQRFITKIESQWIPKSLRDKYPLLYRVAALGIGFFCNMGISLAISAIGMSLGTAAGQLKLAWFPRVATA